MWNNLQLGGGGEFKSTICLFQNVFLHNFFWEKSETVAPVHMCFFGPLFQSEPLQLSPVWRVLSPDGSFQLLPQMSNRIQIWAQKATSEQSDVLFWATLSFQLCITGKLIKFKNQCFYLTLNSVFCSGSDKTVLLGVIWVPSCLCQCQENICFMLRKLTCWCFHSSGGAIVTSGTKQPFSNSYK